MPLENPLDNMPLHHLLDENLLLIALGLIIALAVITRILRFVNGSSNPGGTGIESDDHFDGGGGDGGGGE